jgi:hypothetical protein
LIRRARVAGLLAAATALAACGGDTSGSAAHHPASTTTATVTATSGGGGSVNIGIICSTPRDAALAVVNAWMSNNRAAARRCGAPAALETLFARAAGPEGWIVQRCTGTVCSFTHPYATVRLTMGGSDAAGWVVSRVAFGR